MTFAQIREHSSQQLSKCRYKAIISLVLCLLAKLFFVCLKLVFADFLIYNKMIDTPYQLFGTTDIGILGMRLVLSLSELFLITFFLTNAVIIYCFNSNSAPKRIAVFARLCLLQGALALAKFPFLLCFYISFALFRNIVTVYNAESSQLAIALLLFGAALCFYLMYIYFLSGMFVFPYLISNGERFSAGIMRSYYLMQNKRGKLLKLILSSLPEALLIFTLPDILMRFAVFAKYCAHDFDYLD